MKIFILMLSKPSSRLSKKFIIFLYIQQQQYYFIHENNIYVHKVIIRYNCWKLLVVRLSHEQYNFILQENYMYINGAHFS